MPKLNCWEYTGCGREVGGANAGRLGVCPTPTEKRLGGVNDGVNGGRACWVIAGTMCGGEVQGTYAKKIVSCVDCDFYHLVRLEEGEAYRNSTQLLAMLKLASSVPDSPPGSPRRLP